MTPKNVSQHAQELLDLAKQHGWKATDTSIGFRLTHSSVDVPVILRADLDGDRGRVYENIKTQLERPSRRGRGKNATIQKNMAFSPVKRITDITTLDEVFGDSQRQNKMHQRAMKGVILDRHQMPTYLFEASLLVQMSHGVKIDQYTPGVLEYQYGSRTAQLQEPYRTDVPSFIRGLCELELNPGKPVPRLGDTNEYVHHGPGGYGMRSLVDDEPEGQPLAGSQLTPAPEEIPLPANTALVNERLSIPVEEDLPSDNAIVVETTPYKSRSHMSSKGGTVYDSPYINVVTYSDGTVRYACAKCGYERGSIRPIIPHHRSHVDRTKSSEERQREREDLRRGLQYVDPTAQWQPTSRQHAVAARLAKEIREAMEKGAVSPEDIASLIVENRVRTNPGASRPEDEQNVLTADEVLARIRLLLDDGTSSKVEDELVDTRQRLEDEALANLEMEQAIEEMRLGMARIEEELSETRRTADQKSRIAKSYKDKLKEVRSSMAASMAALSFSIDGEEK
ncbi:hypothetical protein [Kocuria oceani]|uniref:C2H2-type domain-containing protein n=1 Tax=Kocuria oceani TaxID=988827 RepID=A0ABV9TIC7_9MICC|nr:hypothetical protein [Kocuria oceani]